MNIQDLRLGNFVMNSNNFEMTVEGIIRDEVYLDFPMNEGDLWEENADDLQGIPLNEDWLKRFGFRKNGMAYILPEFYINKWSDGTLKYSTIGGFFDVKNVHQLQNLYHALTNTELTLKKEL